MSKIILLAFSMILLGGVALYIFLSPKETDVAIDADCAEICGQLSLSCPTLTNQASCEMNCSRMSVEEREAVKQVKSCEEFVENPDAFVNLFIANPDKINFENPSNSCDTACSNYVTQCLTLVPNITESVLYDGYTSCTELCPSWTTEKVNCIVSANDCVAISEECGL